MALGPDDCQSDQARCLNFEKIPVEVLRQDWTGNLVRISGQYPVRTAVHPEVVGEWGRSLDIADDDLTVAVGFNPRNEPGDLKSREATIGPPEIWRSDRTSLRDLLLVWSHARGLKATATFKRRSAAADSALVRTNNFEMHGSHGGRLRFG